MTRSDEVAEPKRGAHAPKRSPKRDRDGNQNDRQRKTFLHQCSLAGASLSMRGSDHLACSGMTETRASSDLCSSATRLTAAMRVSELPSSASMIRILLPPGSPKR